MKFRFRPSKALRRLKSPETERKLLRLKGINTLRRRKKKALVPNYSAEGFGVFGDEAKKSRFSLLGDKLRQSLRGLYIKAKKRASRWLRKEPRISTAALWGTLCATASVTVISGIVVIISLFWGYGGSYTHIRIPNFVSLDVNSATQVYPELFEYDIVYESNPDCEPQSVISQTPPAEVVRKLYKKDKKLKIALTVSKEPDSIILPEVVGTSLRDTVLMLKSAGINVDIIEEHSSSVASGVIFSSSLPKGSVLKRGDKITLSASLGKELVYINVPALTGLGEQEAIALLNSKGLKAGEISYKSSKDRLGTVISQSYSEGTPLPEGSKVGFSVSGGLYYSLD